MEGEGLAISFNKALLESRIRELVTERSEVGRQNVALSSRIEEMERDHCEIQTGLKSELDRHIEALSTLEAEKRELQKAKEDEKAKNVQAFQEYCDKMESRVVYLKKELEKTEAELSKLREFSQMKNHFDAKIESLKQEIASKDEMHKQEIADLELGRVQERERLKREMLSKIQQTKKNLLRLTEEQLDTATQRTMRENEQMATELHFQSRQIDSLLEEVRSVRDENHKLKFLLKFSEQENVGHCRRVNAFQKLSNHFISKSSTSILPSREEKDSKNRARSLANENKVLHDEMQRVLAAIERVQLELANFCLVTEELSAPSRKRLESLAKRLEVVGNPEIVEEQGKITPRKPSIASRTQTRRFRMDSAQQKA